jgi:hypothetical protein
LVQLSNHKEAGSHAVLENVWQHLHHRVETYRDVTDRSKNCGSLRFHVPTFFQATGKKMIKLRVLSKFKVSRHQVVIQSDACI